jgi:acyl-homoserine-lactone acylase
MTPNLGWAYTLNYNDFCDVYRLKINPKNKRQYWYDGQWRELEDNSVPLAVKLGGLTIRLKRKAFWSVYGPTLQTKKGTYAMRFPGLERIGSIEQVYRMNRARNLQEFKAALNLQQNPSVNIVYADRFDNLFYISNGLYPDRDPKYNWRYVVPGDTSATRWTRVLPMSAIPQVENPSSGFVFSVNNSPFSAAGKCCNVDPATVNPTMGIATGNNNRAVTLSNNLDNDQKFSYEEFKRLKYDMTFPTNSASALSLQRIFDTDPARYPTIAEGLKVLKKWNRSTDTTNLQAGLFFKSFWRLFEKKKAGMLELDEGFSFTDEEMVDAVSFGMKWMKKHFGKLEVPYGEIQRHTRGKVNLAIGGMPDVLAAMLSKPMKHKKGEKGFYRASAGESYILLVTYGPNGPERIESVNAYGSSNVPSSPHYTDQMGMFVRQQTKPMTLDRATIEREAERIYQPE